MQALLSQWLSHAASGALCEYASYLLSLFEAERRVAADKPEVLRASGLVEGLTPRELEVLALVCAGHSNQVIADKLVITVATVKKHTGNILGKLGVTSRAQAMVRARELGLISGKD